MRILANQRILACKNMLLLGDKGDFCLPISQMLSLTSGPEAWLFGVGRITRGWGVTWHGATAVDSETVTVTWRSRQRWYICK